MNEPTRDEGIVTTEAAKDESSKVEFGSEDAVGEELMVCSHSISLILGVMGIWGVVSGWFVGVISLWL